ncbi:MAG: hypothetical protein QOJ06_2154, partial [Pseudonocardiales bacterium]|nr:hypothetical protein [Pseudonocardiales bacterium]
SGRFGANSAWVLCAAIAHNLLHAAGTLAGDSHRVARGATLRRQIITVPARLARPARTPILHLPRRWPWAPAWLRLCNRSSAQAHQPPPDPARAPPRPDQPQQWKSWTDQQPLHAPPAKQDHIM